MSNPLSSRSQTVVLAVQLVRGRSSPPMIEQLVVQIRSLIQTTRLPPASRLPSSRELARELGVSRTVVTEVYAILMAEGYLETRRGSGTFVIELPMAAPPSGSAANWGSAASSGSAANSDRAASDRDRNPRWLGQAIDPPAIDPPYDPDVAASFRICEPEPNSFPDRAWRTCARAAIAESLPDGYAPIEGDEALREAISIYVARERGLRCTPAEIVVTAGTTQSLDLISRATLAAGTSTSISGSTAVAFEDPGYRLARQIFTDRGTTVRPVPVDDAGLDVARLSDSDPPLSIYTTPSHQFPLGSVLSYTRRFELLDWAARHDVLVIEDDYDSEFRLDGPALPALAASDEHGSVAYLGTFSKALAPSLRVGFLIAPPQLREAVLRLKVRTDYHSNWTTQRMLARYLTSGAFGRHLRRMRRLYRERRDRLVEAFEPLPDGAVWVGLAAGLHATIRLPEQLSARLVADRCLERGVFVRTLSDYSCGAIDGDGLVLGYGASSCSELEAMAKTVRDVMRRVGTPSPVR